MRHAIDYSRLMFRNARQFKTPNNESTAAL